MSNNSVAYHMNKKELWSEHAEEYAQMFAKGGGLTQPLVDALLSIANKVSPLSKATAILDEGCGTGLAIAAIISTYGETLPSEARLMAGDFSSGMIEQVDKTKAKMAASSPAWARLETQVLDAQDLKTIPDNSLSHVVSNLCIYGVPDPLGALQEAHRVLAPGGAVSVSGLGSVPWMDALSDANLVRPEASFALDFPEDWKDPEKLGKLLQKAGFEGIETSTVDMPLQLPSPKTFFRSFIATKNPGLALFRDWSDAEKDRMAEVAEERLRKTYGEGTITLHGLGIIAGGRKQ